MSSTKPTFSPGELVNVTIRGARIIPGVNDRINLHLGASGTGRDIVVPFPYLGVSVERVAPAEWPPQPGDIFADRFDNEWVCTDSDGETILMSEIGGAQNVDALDVLADFGPMRLVRRRGWTPATETTPAEPEQVDERAELVAGLRELADLIEAHPQLTGLPRTIDWQPGEEQFAQWVEVLDARLTDHPHEGTMQHWANASLRGLRVHLAWIEDLPVEAEPVATQPQPTTLATEPLPQRHPTFDLGPLDEDAPEIIDVLLPAAPAPAPGVPLGPEIGEEVAAE